MSTTTKGFRYPAEADPNDVPLDIQRLATDLDTGVPFSADTFVKTTAQRDALAGAARYVGRVIFNSTVSLYQYWDGAAWQTIGTAADLTAHLAALDPHPQYALDSDLTTHSGGINGAVAHVQQLADGRTNASTPNNYPTGVTSANVTAANGFPINGTLHTVRHAVGRTMQRLINFAGAAADPTVYDRFGLSDDSSWGNWQRVARANEGGVASGFATLDANSRVVQDAIHLTAYAQALVTTLIAKSQVTGDTNDRWELQADGSMLWGPGNATQDVSLRRVVSGRLDVRDAAGSSPADLYFNNLIFAGALKDSATGLRKILIGSGSPEASQTSSPGGIYLRTDGAAGTTVYVKETGTGNTGWVAVPSLAAANIWTAKNRAPVWTDLAQTPAHSATPTWNINLGDVIAPGALTGNITAITFSNVPATGELCAVTLMLTQDGTGGRTVTWPAAVKWQGGTAPTLSGASKTDIITLLTRDGGTTWYGMVAGLNY